eukprot:756127-Hanusia_phi.AAC.1
MPGRTTVSSVQSLPSQCHAAECSDSGWVGTVTVHYEKKLSPSQIIGKAPECHAGHGVYGQSPSQ